MEKQEGSLRPDTPTTYQIRLQGALDESWSDRLGGMNIQVRTEPGQASVTELTGRLQDQAALFGVLMYLYDRGFAVLLVECVDDTVNRIS